MRASLIGLALLQAASAVLASAPEPVDVELSRDSEELARLFKQASQEAESQIKNSSSNARKIAIGGCGLGNFRVRKEWGSLSKQERKAYTDAVRCLQSSPAKTPSSVAAGAKSRYDDFVATHIMQSLNIHYTGNFLSWHRWFTWVYEEALRNECGYQGAQPYWDWAQTAVTGMTKSPIFDGSDTSMSGDGAFEGSRGDIVLGKGIPGLTPIYLPAGTGGGCVKSGPFKNMSVNLGPAALALAGGDTIANPEGPLAYNPRCLKRDLTTEVNRRYANASSILSNILQPQNVDDFQLQMQGRPGSGTIGVHGGGHYSIGGDPGRDVFTSPGDPIFYLHHGMIDRVWMTWQSLNPVERIYSDKAVAGTNTFLNQPPSADTTLDDIIDLGYAGGGPKKIRDLLSTIGGPFCYIYAVTMNLSLRANSIAI